MGKDFLRRVLRLAGAYAACAIGSGFATGQEILQFFTAHGLMSLSGVLVTAALFSWGGACFMMHGYELALDSPEKAVAFYRGKRPGIAATLVMQILLYSFYIIMISGAGAVLSECFGAPIYLGRILMILLTLLTVLLGLHKLANVLGQLGIVLIVFSLLVGMLGFARHPDGLREVPMLLTKMDLPRSGGSWLAAAFLYPGYNAVFLLFFSCCLGAAAESRKEALVGGALGGLLLGLAILVMDLGLMANLTRLGGRAVPTLVLAEQIHPGLAQIFSGIIFLGIYTTATPLLWSLVRTIAEDRTKASFLTATGLSAAGFFLGMADFEKLINIIYPISGMLGIAVLLLTAFRDRQFRGQWHQ